MKAALHAHLQQGNGPWNGRDEREEGAYENCVEWNDRRTKDTSSTRMSRIWDKICRKCHRIWQISVGTLLLILAP